MDEHPQNLFGNTDVLVGAMGRWPSFHDARFKRGVRAGDTCSVSIHVFETTNKVGPHGSYEQTKHTLVTLQMCGVSECSLPEGYGGDVLFDLTAEHTGELIKVVFDSATDPNQSWWVVCRSPKVTDVMPCGARGERAI